MREEHPISYVNFVFNLINFNRHYFIITCICFKIDPFRNKSLIFRTFPFKNQAYIPCDIKQFDFIQNFSIIISKL